MNRKRHTLRLSPSDREFTVEDGVALQDVLFEHGAEFPCGGRGRCKGCRVRMLEETLAVTECESRLLTQAELADGWRLSCQHLMSRNLHLELAQWEMNVLGNTSEFHFSPRAGLGVAVDLGTTTIVAQLVDRRTGNVLAGVSALNAQARHGADVMTRMDHAVAGGQAELENLVRRQLGGMIAALLRQASAEDDVSRVVIVGNTVMHHVFCGVSVKPLAQYPFVPERAGLFQFPPHEVGWMLPDSCTVEFLPCLGGFVGSDILAGIAATGLDRSSQLTALVDLGTNGEVVVGTRDKLLCASTAAGPAFEGARISYGMRASEGAISHVRVEGGSLACRTIGGAPARGLCGSGLVDAVAASLNLGWIEASGRLATSQAIELAPKVILDQCDVRELQLAKGAIAAGLRLLTNRLGAALDDVWCVHLAGAFGNYVSRASAQRIGLLHFAPERVQPAGNTALLGAKLGLFEDADRWESIRRRVEHVSLNEDPQFQETYVEEMRFPD